MTRSRSIAIVGSGASGLVCAWVLGRRHDVTVFEAESRLGGHVHTIPVPHEGRVWNVDTGFIVFNERNYPRFTRLLRQLEVPTRPTAMSFSVSCQRTGVEFGGHSVMGLLAGFRGGGLGHLRLLADIVRLGLDAPGALAGGESSLPLGEFLRARGYSSEFIDRYIIPMGSAIWSSPGTSVERLPVSFFLRFFENHGMLRAGDGPRWRVVEGGSAAYVRALARQARATFLIGDPVVGVTPSRDGELPGLTTASGARCHFDDIILCAHADQTLAMLEAGAGATPTQREVLGAIPYRVSRVLVHTDPSVLPRDRRAWAAWNYSIPETGRGEDDVRVTYNMSILQSLDTAAPICVTLNDVEGIDPARVVRTLSYAHPQYSKSGIASQARHGEISGKDGLHFAGAYWGYGFHEDAVVSGLRVCGALGSEM